MLFDKSKSYVINYNIVFSTEIPIINSSTLQYYHLFPIPTTYNTIIVLPNEYLALHENNCHEEQLKSNNQVINQEEIKFKSRYSDEAYLT